MRKILFAIVILTLFANCTSSSDSTELIALPPVLATSPVSNITFNSASCGGSITASENANITERGLVWSLSTNPTVTNFKLAEGNNQIGTFTLNLTNLTPSTTYYVRAYAINSAGTSYGNQVSFTTSAIPITYAIGDIGPGGGYVFKVDSSGLHGKEIAPISTQFQSQWGCPTSSVAGTSASVGYGQANSTLILNYHNSINYYANPSQCTAVVMANGTVAAKNCADLVFNGHDDWYLPSIQELVLVYNNLISPGLADFGTNPNQLLSSSTQSTTNYTKFVVLQTNGLTWDLSKNDLTKHRAVRDF